MSTEKDKPRIFKVRSSNAEPLSGCVAVLIFALEIALIGILFPSLAKMEWQGILFLVVVTCILGFFGYLFLPDQFKKTKSQARIELLPDELKQFGYDGNLIASGRISEIESLLARPDSFQRRQLGGPTCDVYIVAFRDGQKISFDSCLDDDFVLKKILRTRTGMTFIDNKQPIEQAI